MSKTNSDIVVVISKTLLEKLLARATKRLREEVEDWRNAHGMASFEWRSASDDLPEIEGCAVLLKIRSRGYEVDYIKNGRLLLHPIEYVEAWTLLPEWREKV